MLKKIFITLTIIWAIVIFMFSSRNGNESTSDSSRLGMEICRIFVDGFENMASKEQSDLAKRIDYPVRKAAHATEYAILGIFIFGSIYNGYNGKKSCGNTDGRKAGIIKYAFPAWTAGTFYAVTDEIHQLFVPGRSGKALDVCIDSAGVFAGILFFLIVLMIVGKFSNQKL